MNDNKQENKEQEEDIYCCESKWCITDGMCPYY